MRFAAPLIEGRFLRRHQRFLAEIQLAGERRVWAHVPNTGALTGLLVPGQRVLLTEEPRSGRKTSHTWRFARAEDSWVCVDTMVPNRLVAEALAAGALPWLPRILSFRPEAPLPQGERLDFVADVGDGLLFLEVKSITWVEEGVALFPDGVTQRGRRHLEVLREMVQAGHQAWQVFVVQREDAVVFRPAAAVDPAYSRELSRAAAAGVQILVLQEKVSPPEITLAEPLPYDLY